MKALHLLCAGLLVMGACATKEHTAKSGPDQASFPEIISENSEQHLSESLDQRRYRFDMQYFWPEFQRLTQVDETIRAKREAWTISFNAVPIVQDAFIQLLKEKEGVSLPPPAAVFLDDRRGEVLVRGTPHQCEAVKNLLTELNAQPILIAESR
jgi:hypothetical protein